MSQLAVSVMANKNSQLDTNSVTHLLINTCCIVCGTTFPVARASKLYCSSRCKQFGYNHRIEILQALAKRERGINPTPISFCIDDYNDYCTTQRMVKRFKELDKKRKDWDAISQEIKLSENAGVPIRNSAWDRYVRDKLTGEEESELYHYQCNLDEYIQELNLKELSIEQWSFIKHQHPELKRNEFFLFLSSLGREFMDQLRIREADSEIDNQIFIIRNKFINHCNLIAEGIIKFDKNPEVEEK
jgi:hypothetical protein